MKRSKWMKLLASLFALSLIAAACGSETADSAADVVDSGSEGAVNEAETALAEAQEAQAAAEAAAADAEERAAAAEAAAAESGDDGDDGAVPVVTVSGPERSESEAGALNQALQAFGNANGISIIYQGSADWETEINIQLEAGTNPDISVFPQPGNLRDAADAGHVQEVPAEVVSAASANWTEDAINFANFDGTQFGLPNKNDLKSLVWYQPARFEAAGYEIPETLDDLFALSDQMIADGNTPWCVGIESGGATGWPFTDWVEDIMLRTTTPENYDAWVAGELTFSSPELQNAFQIIIDEWNKPGAVFAAGGSIATTAFQANGEPLVNGDCFMHRQASFFSAFFPEGTPVADGSEGAVDVFFFPGNGTDRPVLGGGTFVGAFNDRPEVWAVMEYFASPEYANARQEAQQALQQGDSEDLVLSGFVTANTGADPSLWHPLESNFVTILQEADVFRFDASDLIGGDVNNAFWEVGTQIVNGDVSVEDGTAEIDTFWP